LPVEGCRRSPRSAGAAFLSSGNDGGGVIAALGLLGRLRSGWLGRRRQAPPRASSPRASGAGRWCA
jgi:hypothetical protein